MKKWLRALFLSVALTSLFLSTAHANILVNGGFEAPALSNGTWSVFPSIPGWTTTFGPGIEIQNHVAGAPFEGDQLVELDSYSNSIMTQNIVTTPGEVYRLSFAYSPRPGVAIGSNGIDAYFNNDQISSVTSSAIWSKNTLWTVFACDVKALTNLSSLEFRATGKSDAVGGYIDDVKLAPVPEPASMLLLGSGLLGIMGLRKNKGDE